MGFCERFRDRAIERRDAKYWRNAYEELVRQTGRDLNDGRGSCRCCAATPDALKGGAK